MIFFVALFVMSAALLAAPSLVRAMRAASHARAEFRAAAQAITTLEHHAASTHLDAATADLDEASAELSSPWASPARHLPWLGRQIGAANELASAGKLAADAGRAGLERIDPSLLHVRGGAIDLGALARMREGAEVVMPKAQAALAGAEATPSSFLVAPLAHAREQAVTDLQSAVDSLGRAEAGLRAAPPVLGANGKRRYLVLFANPAEARGTGGFWGLFTLMETDHGKISLLPVTGRPSKDLPSPDTAKLSVPQWYRNAWGNQITQSWADLNMTSDFPTAARLASEVMAGTKTPVDGVLQIDPAGLGALLHWTGPAQIASWPEPITADNIERIAEHDVYARYPSSEDQRTEFGKQAIGAVFGQVLRADLHVDGTVAAALAAAVSGGHMQFWTPTEASDLSAAGVSHGADRAADATDVLGVIVNNASANKADWFAHKKVTYDVRIDPDAGTATTTTTVVLRNDAPSAGEPTYVIGPNAPGFTSGEIRTFVTLLRSSTDELRSVRLDGIDVTASKNLESAVRAYTVEVRLEPGQSRTIVAKTVVRGVSRTAAYRLGVISQALAHVCDYRITLRTPLGWKSVDPATYEGPLPGDLKTQVRASRTGLGWVLHIISAPFRVTEVAR